MHMFVRHVEGALRRLPWDEVTPRLAIHDGYNRFLDGPQAPVAGVEKKNRKMVDPNSNQEKFYYVYSCDLDTNLELKV